MTEVLIVEDDPSFATTLARSLESESYHVTVAASVEQAVVALHASRFDVMLTDLRMGDRDGIDLLATARDLPAAPRAILMSGYASAKDHQTATDLGAVRVLCKPFTPRELLDAVKQAVECETGFHGTIHGMSLVDLLQMFHLSRRSVVVRVGGNTPALLHLDAGEVVHASRGTRVGVDAFVRTLNTRTGSVQTTTFDPTVLRTISAPFDALLLDALRADDEYRRDSGAFQAVDPIASDLELDFGSIDEPTPPVAARSWSSDARDLWHRAALVVGPPLADATVIAFDETTSLSLQGSLDPEAIATAARSVLSASHRLAGGEGLSVVECVSGSSLLAVLHAHVWSLAVLDAMVHPSRSFWLRSAIATLGRLVSGSEK